MSDSNTPRNPNDPVRVYYVRAEEDDDLARELDKHLAIYRRPSLLKKRPALLATWHPGSVKPGDEREAEDRRHLDEAELAVTFISRDLWVSDRYKDLERALELRADGKLRVVPIVGRPVLPDHDLSELAALPRRGGPLDKHPDGEQAFVDVALEIVALAQAIQGQQGTAPSAPIVRAEPGVFAEARRKETLYSGPAPQTVFLEKPPAQISKEEVTAREGLERVVRATNQFQDIARWSARLSRVQRQVCKIELPTSSGTGFLIGPDLVLTNYHVIETLLATPSHVGFVSVVFDDAAAVVGSVAVEPRRCNLRVNNWLVKHRPYSAQEATGSVDPERVLPDELDYALLRLAQTPGNDVIARTAAGEPILRGWLEGKAFPFLPGSPLFIVQHPEGASMKLALDTDAVIKLSSNGLRVTYRTNTEPGSSGAPCFNQQWELVALHHHGTAQQNQGIPIMKILAEISGEVRLQPPPA